MGKILQENENLEKLAKKISDNGGEVFYQKLDVTQKLECDSFAKAVLGNNSNKVGE